MICTLKCLMANAIQGWQAESEGRRWEASCPLQVFLREQIQAGRELEFEEAQQEQEMEAEDENDPWDEAEIWVDPNEEQNLIA